MDKIHAKKGRFLINNSSKIGVFLKLLIVIWINAFDPNDMLENIIKLPLRDDKTNFAWYVITQNLTDLKCEIRSSMKLYYSPTKGEFSLDFSPLSEGMM